MPPAGWSVPPRPQPWYPQHQPGSVPAPTPMGLPQQPLFPIHNVRLPVSPATLPGHQLSLPITPPGMPTAISQPLFPVAPNSNTSAQSSPFSAPTPPMSFSVSSLEMNSAEVHVGGSTLPINSYQSPEIPGLCFHPDLFQEILTCYLSVFSDWNWSGFGQKEMQLAYIPFVLTYFVEIAERVWHARFTYILRKYIK